MRIVAGLRACRGKSCQLIITQCKSSQHTPLTPSPSHSFSLPEKEVFASLFTVEVAKMAVLKILHCLFAGQQDHLLIVNHWNERVVLISRVTWALWLLYLEFPHYLNTMFTIHILPEGGGEERRRIGGERRRGKETKRTWIWCW